MSFYTSLTQSLNTYSINPNNRHLVVDDSGVHVAQGKDPHFNQTIQTLTRRIAQERLEKKDKDSLKEATKTLAEISKQQRGWFQGESKETQAALSALNDTVDNKQAIDAYRDMVHVPQTRLDIKVSFIKGFIEEGANLQVLANHFPEDVLLQYLAENPSKLDSMEKILAGPFPRDLPYPEPIILLMIKDAASDLRSPANIDLSNVASLDWTKLEPLLAEGHFNTFIPPQNLRNFPASGIMDIRIPDKLRQQLTPSLQKMQSQEKSQLESSQKLDRQLNSALDDCLAFGQRLAFNSDVGWHASNQEDLSQLAIVLSDTPIVPEVARELKDKLSRYQKMGGRKASESEFELIHQILDAKITSTSDLTQEQLAAILMELAEKDDPAAFSREFIPAFRRSEGFAKTIANELATVLSDNQWLKRIVLEPLWLSAITEENTAIRETHVDLQNVRREDVEALLKQAKPAGSLTVSLNNSQDDLIALLNSRVLNNVTGLDLSKCQPLDWKVMEPLLARMPNLIELKLPQKLTEVDPVKPIQGNFRKELKEDLAGQLLKYVEAQNKSNRGGPQQYDPHEEL